MRKKLITLLISTLFICTTLIPSVSASSNPPIYQSEYIINEYTAFKEQTNLTDENSYLNTLRSYTMYSPEELKKLPITEGNKEIINKIRENPNYIPSESELTRAAAELKMNLDADVHRFSSSTKIDVVWSFDWSAWPINWMTDGVAVTWSGDYTIDEDNVSARVNYGDESTHIWKDMDNTFDIAHNGYSSEFSVVKSIKLGKEYVQCLGGHGEGSFSLYCYDHSHNACQIQWSYGHSVMTLSPGIGVSFGLSGPSTSGSISFKSGVQALSSGIDTFRSKS